MIAAPKVDFAYTLTDGEIALNNLESTRRRSWSRFWQGPSLQGIAEYIVEQEQFTLQFTGDAGALDRLEQLVSHLNRVAPDSPRTALINAKVASTAHRFAEARKFLDSITDCVELSAEVEHLTLSIDQACGANLAAVLQSRQRIATESGRLEDLVPLGALNADLRNFEDANELYERGLREYQGTSPFAVAWVCFQLGILWGELVSEMQLDRAAAWYQHGIQYLPGYVKARVHLSEIYLRSDLASKAEALLIPVAQSGDPEVSWHLSDVLFALGRDAEAREQLQVARAGFDLLLEKHLLAFADHGAEFYSGSGDDPQRAFELANINLSNRPTIKAFEQTHEAAIATGLHEKAAEILAHARQSWGMTHAFALSALSEIQQNSGSEVENA
jgi:hypothetical protein